LLLEQGTFTTIVSAMKVTIANFAAASVEPGGGDVAGIAQATLRACNPAADVAVTKTNGTNPSVAGLSCTALTCVGVIGSTSCPDVGLTTIAALQGTGIVLPSMTAPSSISFAITCGNTATGQ